MISLPAALSIYMLSWFPVQHGAHNRMCSVKISELMTEIMIFKPSYLAGYQGVKKEGETGGTKMFPVMTLRSGIEMMQNKFP